MTTREILTHEARLSEALAVGDDHLVQDCLARCLACDQRAYPGDKEVLRNAGRFLLARGWRLRTDRDDHALVFIDPGGDVEYRTRRPRAAGALIPTSDPGAARTRP